MTIQPRTTCFTFLLVALAVLLTAAGMFGQPAATRTPPQRVDSEKWIVDSACGNRLAIHYPLGTIHYSAGQADTQPAATPLRGDPTPLRSTSAAPPRSTSTRSASQPTTQSTQPTTQSTQPTIRPLPPLTPARLLPASMPATPQLAALGPMKVAKPTTAIPQKGCVTAQCHASVKNYKVVHGPVNVNACDSCHKLTDASKHAFVPARNKTEICTFCHKTDYGTATLIHKPVANGDCLPCHNPHGAPNKRFLRGQTMNDLCNSCHRDVVAGQKAVHGPIAAGACGACHQPHASSQPRLLTAMGRDLCLSCHVDMKLQMEQAAVKHKAVEQDCMNCHEPHASNFAMQTRQAPLQLCSSQCHQDVRKAALEAPYRHAIVTKDDACLNCHTAHGGNLAKLMKAQPVQVCLKCHDKPIRSGQVTIASVAEVLEPTFVKHGPIANGSCGGCHNVHGSTVAHLLAKPYPPTFYESFDVQKYALCFSCHDRQLAEARRTTTLTRFRNGDVNLHYVHVNKIKGRTCRACHSTHASPIPMHIRESVPYGSWKMPVSYTPAKTGGNCSAGCHRELGYDRNAPVAPTTAEIPNQPSSPLPLTTTGQPPATQPAATQPVGSEIEDINKVFQGKVKP